MNLRRCKKGHFYNAEQFLKCPYCAGIMEFKGDNDNDDDDEDTVNPFIDEELDIEDEGNTEVETPVKILDKEYDAVKTGLMPYKQVIFHHCIDICICVQNLKITYSVSTALIDKNDQFAGTLTKTTWQVILPPGRKIFINTRNKITLM